MDWMELVTETYLRVDEGEHTLIVYSDPIVEENKFGKQQIVATGAALDGLKGKIVLPKTLAKILKQEFEATNEWPVKIRFKRTGMSLDTKFTLVASETL